MNVSQSLSICDRLSINPDPPQKSSRLGIALSTLGQQPINGVRHPVDGDMNGWYLWCGKWSDAEEFFKPLHIEHIGNYLSQVEKYLDLPPGYRFLLDNKGFEDVWFDESLLHV